MPSSQVQTVSPSALTVLPPGFSRRPFHDSALSTSDSKTGESVLTDVRDDKPFVVYHDSFRKLLGDEVKVTTLAKKDYAFAHEAGIYDPHDDSIWFTSNLLTEESGSRKVEINRVSLQTGCVEVQPIPEISLANGGCWYDNGLLFCDQGSSDRPSQLVWVNPRDPSETRVVINNYHGRAFNSLNDVIILDHTSGPLIFFTDPPYGNEQGFRPTCEMPPGVHVLDPSTGVVRMVADGFAHPNGIAFSPDGNVCYVTDTSHIHGTGRLDPSKPSSIYAFDVERPTGAEAIPSLRNRRLFAFADCGVPDGIKCDTFGNVYAGCGDGLHIWNEHGLLIGKIVLGFSDQNLGAGCANFCFAPDGRTVCLSEDRIYLVSGLAVEGASIR